MRVLIVAFGRLKAGPERELATRYLERAQAIARSVGVTSVELREFDESRARRPAERKSEEAALLDGALTPGARLIALDERGKALSSEDFAADLAAARDRGDSAYVLALGGADGFDDSVRAQAAKTIAYGAATWPHQLARVMALEQVYRALTILAGHPYHRA